MKLNNIIIVLWIAYCLFDFVKNKRWVNYNRQISIFLLPFIVLVIGLIYGIQVDSASVIEKKLSLFIFPFFLGVGPKFSLNSTRIILKLLVYAVSIACLICISVSIFRLYTNNDWAKAFSYYYTYKSFSEPLRFHPSYFSWYILSAIYILVIYNRDFKKLETLIFAVVFNYTIFILLSRVMIAFYLISVVVYFLFFLKRNLKLALPILIFLIVFIGISAKYSTHFKERFSIGIIKSFNGDGNNKGEDRFSRLDCVLSSFFAKPIFGHGTGSESTVLNSCYIKQELNIAYQNDYNSHNEFFSWGIRHGAFGLITFTGFILYFFLKFRQQNNLLGMLFLTSFVAFSLVENVLSLQKGVVFFSFMTSFIFFNPIKRSVN
ncbi:O-antigen ligase family protein [Fulvivirga kasyanovii]|uniref:O-antigen ligase family protein n=1 Tax=Fulvivirga kasyanovii TaxID=396812 RepID=UPI0031DE8930